MSDAKAAIHRVSMFHLIVIIVVTWKVIFHVTGAHLVLLGLITVFSCDRNMSLK